MQKLMRVRGVLLTDYPAMEDRIENIYEAAQRSARWLILEGNNRLNSSGTIEINNSAEVTEIHHGVVGFVTQLKTLLSQEEIIPVRYNGVIIITVDSSEEPFLMRVNVRDGKIFYQDGHVRWNPETPY